MLIKVAPIGSQVKEVSVEDATTVKKALEIAGIGVEGRTITVNNQPATEDTPITADGSIIALAGKMKGGR